MPDLNFDQHHSTWGTHGLHAFAAKFPPQLAKYALRYYTRRGDLVLDPMMGSGTTLVEARVMGRHAIGFDIDPLARLMAKVKSTPVQTNSIREAAQEIVSRVSADISDLCTSFPSPEAKRRAALPSFHNRDYWFKTEVSTALALFSFHIADAQIDDSVRDFLWIVFSSVILAKTSVANARDIIHSRHHFWQHETVPDVVARFSDRLKRTTRQMDEFVLRTKQSPEVEIVANLGDARSLPLKSGIADLIITSPPYATALDYPRAHFLAIAWMSKCFGLTLENYMGDAARYIGSERGKIGNSFQPSEALNGKKLTTKILYDLAMESERHANLVQRYFVDMKQVFAETARVLKMNRHAIFVVCPSHLRKVEIPTHEVLVELAAEYGLRAKHIHVRTIASNRRILPYVKEAFGDRMSTEYVLIFQKH